LKSATHFLGIWLVAARIEERTNANSKLEQAAATWPKSIYGDVHLGYRILATLKFHI
jgi:hypothetical protein